MLTVAVLILSLPVIWVAAGASIPTTQTDGNVAMHKLTKRDWNVQMCSEEQRKVIEAAIWRLRGMLEASSRHLSDFHTFLYNQLTEQEDRQGFLHNKNEHLPTYLRTFSRLYWPVMDEDTNLSNDLRKKTFVVNNKRMLTDELLKGIDDPTGLQILCNDDWLMDTYPNGDPPKKGPGYKIDGRPSNIMLGSVSGNRKEIWWPWVWSNPIGKDNPGDLNSVLLDGIGTGYLAEVLVLKPSMFDRWRSNLFPSTKVSLTARERNIHEDEMSLQDMIRDRLETVLLHHFSQMVTMVQRDDLRLRSVRDLENPPNSIGPFGWNNAVRMAESSTYLAMENSDNYVFLVVALFLDNWDWASGRNLDIPKLLWYGDNPIWPPPFPQAQRPLPDTEPDDPDQQYSSDGSNSTVELPRL